MKRLYYTTVLSDNVFTDVHFVVLDWSLCQDISPKLSKFGSPVARRGDIG